MVYVINTCGWGNFGADCYVGTLRQHLEEVWPSSKIAVNREDRVPFLPEEQTALVLGGGGILYHYLHNGQTDNLKNFLRYAAVMQAFGKPTFALSLGVQGLLKSEDLKPYVEILNAMNLRTVRDARSAEVLRNAGVSGTIIESADLSYLMKIPVRPPRETGRRPILGVAASQPLKGIAHPEYPGFEGRVLDALNELQHEFEIRFYSFDKRSDGLIAGAWTGAQSCSVYNASSVDAVASFVDSIGQSDLFLTTRLHGVTLCARMGLPFVSIGEPGEKVDRESRALEHSLHLPYSANAAAIADTVRAAWINREEIRKNLGFTVPRRERLARATLEALHACN
jgi:polysaccharide pyruvyl transferase WcaK-like protein